MSVNSLIGCFSSLKASAIMVLPLYQSPGECRHTLVVSHRHDIPTHSSQLTDRPLQAVELGDEGCPAIHRLRIEQPAVTRHLQCGGKHVPGYRFLGDAVLQRPLPAEAK